jgi:hypothetical protein
MRILTRLFAAALAASVALAAPAAQAIDFGGQYGGASRGLYTDPRGPGYDDHGFAIYGGSPYYNDGLLYGGGIRYGTQNDGLAPLSGPIYDTAAPPQPVYAPPRQARRAYAGRCPRYDRVGRNLCAARAVR